MYCSRTVLRRRTLERGFDISETVVPVELRVRRGARSRMGKLYRLRLHVSTRLPGLMIVRRRNQDKRGGNRPLVDRK